MDAPAKILVVDDDGRTRSLLETYLKEQGFAVMTASDARPVEAILATGQVNLLVLDLMLPGEDGLHLCRRLRGRANPVPIIMLTAKGTDLDRIVGLEVGADDYLPKPFNPRELVARIHAVLRRQSAVVTPAPPKALIKFGEWELDLVTRSLTRSKIKARLTSGEFAVFEVLAIHPNQPLSRDKLMDLARGRAHGTWDRSMDVQISRLRRVIEDNAAEPRYIQTVWGVGYVFVPDHPPQ